MMTAIRYELRKESNQGMRQGSIEMDRLFPLPAGGHTFGQNRHRQSQQDEQLESSSKLHFEYEVEKSSCRRIEIREEELKKDQNKKGLFASGRKTPLGPN